MVLLSDPTLVSAVISALVAFAILGIDRFILTPRARKTSYELRELEKRIDAYGSLVALLKGTKKKGEAMGERSSVVRSGGLTHLLEADDIKSLRILFQRKTRFFSSKLLDLWFRLIEEDKYQRMGRIMQGAVNEGSRELFAHNLSEMQEVAELEYEKLKARWEDIAGVRAFNSKLGSKRKRRSTGISGKGLLTIGLILIGVFAYRSTVISAYRIPPDPIYLAVGPPERVETGIKLFEFRFIAYAYENRITICTYVDFVNASKPHYFDFYLPFEVVAVSVRYNWTMITSDYHKDTVDGACSLVRANTSEAEPSMLSKRDYVYLDIYVQQLSAIERIGEKTIILSFGHPGSSDRFNSMKGYFRQPSVELSTLIPLQVTVGADKDSFFSSETSPAPDVQFLRSEPCFATWRIEFSGPLAGYYRSIYCTAKNTKLLEMRELRVFASGILISVGVSLLVEVELRPYLARHVRGDEQEDQTTKNRQNHGTAKTHE